MEVEQHWKTRRLVPAAYDVVIEHERLARLGGRLFWGTDARALYDAFAETGRLPAGSAVLDLPCGGGVAFRGVPPAAGLRYVAADLSPVMIGRARAEAARRGLPIALRTDERRPAAVPGRVLRPVRDLQRAALPSVTRCRRSPKWRACCGPAARSGAAPS